MQANMPLVESKVDKKSPVINATSLSTGLNTWQFVRLEDKIDSKLGEMESKMDGVDQTGR